MSMFISKLLKVFIKSNFPNGSKVIDGFRYTLEKSNQSNDILVYIYPVEGLSLSTVRANLIGSFEDLLYDFSKFVTSKGGGPSTFYSLKQYFKFYTEIPKNEVYLNSSDKSELLGIYNTINNINFRYKTFDDEIIDVEFSARFNSVSIYDAEILVKDTVKINSLYVDGESSQKKVTDLMDLMEREDGIYDYFIGKGKFGEVIDFFWARPRIIDPNSDIFVAFEHNWVS